MKQKQNRREAEPCPSPGKILLCGVLGCACMLALTFFLAWMIGRELLPPEHFTLMGAGIVLLGTLPAAFLASRKGGRKLLSGCGAAAVAFLMLLICGMLLFAGGVDLGRLVLSCAMTAAGGIGGAFLAGALE